MEWRRVGPPSKKSEMSHSPEGITAILWNFEGILLTSRKA